MNAETFKNKYPDTVDGKCISLSKLGFYLEIYRTNDIDTLKSLGIQDLLKDFRSLLNVVEQRRKKLERILKDDL